MKRPSTGRIDFHLHSYASNVTDYYAANSFAIPESYSDPIATYHELKRQGMNLVTLTDHNSIDGVRAMLDAGLPDVFISAEMTTSFPEDGCNIHVTIANMTEAQFAEANRLRPNVYEMIAFVDEQIARESSTPSRNKLAYFMTHPLMSTQNRPYGREGALSLEHIEKCLLLCNCLEVRNGTRTRALNEFTEQLIGSLNREAIERLANKHGIAPKGPTPWRKSVVAGSDDHSGINPGQTWTEFQFAEGAKPTPNDLIEAIRRRQTLPGGAHGGPVTLAHAMLKLLHDGQKKRALVPGGRAIKVGGPVQSLLTLVFDPASLSWRERLAFKGQSLARNRVSKRFARKSRAAEPFEKTLSREVGALISDAGFRRSLAALTRTDERIFLVVSTLVNRLLSCYVKRIAEAGSNNLVCAIKEVVAMVSSNLLVSLPYLLSFLHQSSDRQIVRDVRRAFAIGEREKLVLVTDTLVEVNGVSRSIRKMIAEARRRNIDFTVVTCLGREQRERLCSRPEFRELVECGQLRIFESAVELDFPKYDELKLRVPPFLELLRYFQEQGFTKVQISTPGTIGIAGLLAAKTLQIETASTYHTCFPEYVENFTRDISLEALTWKYMILFYHSVDEVVVPSKFIARLLHERGLRNRSLLILDRWVDLERFHPRHRRAAFWKDYGLEREVELVKFIYVGRVSIEKNLAVLADAYRKLRESHSSAHLIIVGDGPYRAELEARLSGLPVTFTGILEGDELSRAFASADAKLFPSTTDTWGNAPLEAQASGLPVVVSDMGGPQELMIDGLTGFKVPGRDINRLIEAMTKLMHDSTRRRMGLEARRFAEANRVDDPFTAILDSQSYRRRAKQVKQTELAEPVRSLSAFPELISTRIEIDRSREVIAAGA